MDLDRPLDDIVKESLSPDQSDILTSRQRARVNKPGKKRRSRTSKFISFSAISSPGCALSLNISADLKRRVSANAVPTGQKADTENAWKHDLYKTVNKPSNAGGGKGKTEEVIQFPRRKYTEQEKAQVRFV